MSESATSFAEDNWCQDFFGRLNGLIALSNEQFETQKRNVDKLLYEASLDEKTIQSLLDTNKKLVERNSYLTEQIKLVMPIVERAWVIKEAVERSISSGGRPFKFGLWPGGHVVYLCAKPEKYKRTRKKKTTLTIVKS